MEPEHHSMTVIAPVKSGEETALKELLREIGYDIKKNKSLRFADFPTIHFARWVVIPPDLSDPAEPPRPNEPAAPYLLAFGTDHDGSDETLLADLVNRAGTALDAIYSHCDDWPGATEPNPAVSYFSARRVPYGARHIACRRRTVSQLRAAVAARERMDAYVDTALKPARASSNEAAMAAAARQVGAVYDNAAPPPVPNLPPLPPNWQLPALLAAAIGVIGLALWFLFQQSALAGWIGAAVVLGLPAAFLAALWAHEKDDKKNWIEATPPTLPHLGELRRWEDHQVQNQMTHVVTVRSGLFRRRTLRGVLWAVNFLAQYFWNRGELGGIPSIHFARWMLFDNDRRLLFFSNYDGSWENYLGDFIDRASNGLTGVWSNTIGFPPSRLLVGDGSRRAEAFKNWTRQHQIETQVWYSAYPQYSVLNLSDTVALCQPASQTLDALLRRL